MRQPLIVTTLAAAAALSLSACGQGSHSSTSAPSTVKASSATQTQTSTTAPPTQAPATVTQTVQPAPTVTQTHTVQAAPAGGGTGGCSYGGKTIAVHGLSCGFAQNVVAAAQSGSSTAYSPATGRYYSFECDGDSDTMTCGGDGTSTSVQHGGWLQW